MEFLFTTNLNVNQADALYQVYFDQEKYIFRPDANDKKLPRFLLNENMMNGTMKTSNLH